MEKISGFSLVRNGIQFDYPFLESWRSLLPLVDELVLAIGESDDESLLAAKKFAREEGHNKVKIIESVWPLNDPIKKKSGLILSEQTNLALAHCQNDWCFYLQADEVLHEADYQAFKNSFRASQADPKIEAVVFG
jgi:glycosyltransferase involved in cell wall biosynthesis